MLVATLSLAGILAISWLALPMVQLKRADFKLHAGNSHISKANSLMASAITGEAGPQSFTSRESINRTAEALTQAQPLLADASREIDGAASQARSAADLSRLPPWYRDYLMKKADTAALRKQQLEAITAALIKLKKLFDAGETVFTAMEETDRQLGQLQAAMEKIQTSPDEASALFAQLETSLKETKAQLDEEYSRSGLDLFNYLSDSLKAGAGLAALGGQLAEAARAGDQAQAQQVAAEMESRMLQFGTSAEVLDDWWEKEIIPLYDEYEGLQERMEALDAEAAALYGRRG